MAHRSKLRVADWRPETPLTFYHHKPKGSSIKEPPRTVPVGGANPFHEGLMDAKRSGARLSKSVCSGRGWNGTQHMEDIATDHRVRSQERARVKHEGELGRLNRRIDVDLALQERKIKLETG